MITTLLIAWCLLAVTVTIHAAGLSAMLPHVLSAAPDGRFWSVTWQILWVAWRLILLHLTEIAVWALFYWWKCLPDAESSFYFSGVTYATLGYGDLVLPEEWPPARPSGGIGRHPDVRAVHGVFLRRRQQLSRAQIGIQQDSPMKPLLKEIQHNKLLWLLAFVPVVFAAEARARGAHALFVLSVLAIVPLAALLSHATESVAAKTGDADRWSAQCHARQPDGAGHCAYRLARRAVHAGEGVASPARLSPTRCSCLARRLLLGGLKYHVQEYNRVSARMQAGLLFLATVALLIPSAVSQADRRGGRVHSAVEPGPVPPAYRRVRVGHVVFPEDAPRTVRQRRPVRPATRRGQWVWLWPRWPASLCCGAGE